MFVWSWTKKEKIFVICALAFALGIVGLVDLHQRKLDSDREIASRQQFQLIFGSFPGQQTPQPIVTEKLRKKKAQLDRADNAANSFYTKLEPTMVGGVEHKQIEDTRHKAFVEYRDAWRSAKKHGYVVPALTEFRD